jgi:hypothetical protein
MALLPLFSRTNVEPMVVTHLAASVACALITSTTIALTLRLGRIMADTDFATFCGPLIVVLKKRAEKKGHRDSDTRNVASGSRKEEALSRSVHGLQDGCSTV